MDVLRKKTTHRQMLAQPLRDDYVEVIVDMILGKIGRI